jgi:hypothetical protein
MSKIEVNTVEPQCGSTLTLGACGQTVALGSGASATGFGATGAVNWDTANIKTATFTAVSGNGYFCNTTAGAFNITLPASPTAGDIVGLKDYAGTFGTYSLTIDRNGSKLDGFAGNRALDTANTSLSVVYVDSTQGWKSVEEGTGYIGESYVVATSTGTVTTSGNCKIHTFTGPGTFTVSSLASTPANNAVAYVVVAGGGGGGGGNQFSGDYEGGGGGAGGFREGSTNPVTPYTASPLAAACSGLTVTATDYPITVGGGGPFATPPLCTTPGVKGNDAVFSTITSTGGGGGGTRNTPSGAPNGGQPGGSGGGAGQADSPCHQLFFGAGDTPATPVAQGFPGGKGNLNPNPPSASGGGGGGGATVVGGNSPVPAPDNIGGSGGTGATTSISGTPTAYGGGGGGSGYNCGGAAGTGGGGTGSTYPSVAGTSGGDNTGGGGGGGGSGDNHPTATPGGAGGSGIVIIRYKFQ